MEEFAELLLPATDPHHQAVELLVHHLAQRNKDIPGVSDFTWTVHVVQSPDTNAFVLPVSKAKSEPLLLSCAVSRLILEYIFLCVERKSVCVHGDAGSCGRYSPAHCCPGT